MTTIQDTNMDLFLVIPINTLVASQSSWVSLGKVGRNRLGRINYIGVAVQ